MILISHEELVLRLIPLSESHVLRVLNPNLTSLGTESDSLVTLTVNTDGHVLLISLGIEGTESSPALALFGVAVLDDAGSEVGVDPVGALGVVIGNIGGQVLDGVESRVVGTALSILFKGHVLVGLDPDLSLVSAEDLSVVTLGSLGVGRDLLELLVSSVSEGSLSSGAA